MKIFQMKIDQFLHFLKVVKQFYFVICHSSDHKNSFDVALQFSRDVIERVIALHFHALMQFTHRYCTHFYFVANKHVKKVNV